MSARFTPGPWETYGTLVYANRPKDGGTICQVSEVRHSHIVEHKAPLLGSPDRKEIFANARLIAAAPELLEALRDMLAGWQYVRKQHGDLSGVGWDRCEKAALAALAKADGRQP